MTSNPHGRYTHGHEAGALASHSVRTATNSASYLLPVLERGMRILDVGCGPGSITLDLAERVAPGRVIGVENTEAPLHMARAEAARRSDSETRFELGDAMNLPFDDDSFDVVHAHQVLQHLIDPVKALQEMMRVCKPGGWLAARDADYAGMSWYPELPGLDLWRRTYRTAAQRNGAQPDAGRRLRAWAQAAGMTDPQLSGSVWVYADPDTCAWWGNSQADRCSSDTFVTQAKEQALTDYELDNIVSAWREWARAPDAWFCMPHGELLARKS